MTYAKEITGGIWYGVEIPEWLRAFDCREADDAETARTPQGRTLWSSERASADLGLRGDGFYFDTCPVACSTYIDARKADDEELARQVRGMVDAAMKVRNERIEAEKHVAGPKEGGSVLYHPVAIALCNFGWSVICDERTRIVRAFGYNA